MMAYSMARMRPVYRGMVNAAILLCLLLPTYSAQSGVHFTLQSSFSENNLSLTTQDSRSGSASVAFDLGTYFRLGMTHRQAVSKRQGYIQVEDTDTYIYSKEQFHSFANSVDFTIILYYGRIFVPYLQVGVVKKDYLNVTATGDSDELTSSISLPPQPSGGFGLGVRLNRNFSLKLSYTLSQGVRQVRPDLPKEKVLDSYTSVGISYNI